MHIFDDPINEIRDTGINRRSIVRATVNRCNPWGNPNQDRFSIFDVLYKWATKIPLTDSWISVSVSTNKCRIPCKLIMLHNFFTFLIWKEWQIHSLKGFNDKVLIKQEQIYDQIDKKRSYLQYRWKNQWPTSGGASPSKQGRFSFLCFIRWCQSYRFYSLSNYKRFR